MQRGLALFGFLLATTTLRAQDDSYRYAYLSHVEGEVTLQRASEPEPESGSVNVPILPGDRIWTRAGSRAEIRFGSGLVVRLSEGAKLDFVAMDSETILRLWSGSAIVKVAEAPGTFRIDFPAGSIRPTREGSYRIDLESGDLVTLSVERGSAELAGPRGSVLVQSGETSIASPSEPPSIPVAFNTASLDDFDRWSEKRDARTSRTEDIVVRSLPHQVQRYAYDLTDYGDWYREPDYGDAYVWYPRVGVGWAPYSYGYWGYTPFGHTWISSEPWGWAPYHYGRWGFGHRGWYWIPGASWGPAWVSFAIGPTWVGWSPLGYYGAPVFAFNYYYGGHGGYGYYPWRGFRHHRGGWNVCSRDDFRSGYVSRGGYRRLGPEDLGSTENARFVDDVASLDRELNPRVARLRPSASGEASPLRPSASALGASADERTAVRRSPARSFEQASRPQARSRSEEALRGFRERAGSRLPVPRVVDDSGRNARNRDQAPRDVFGIGRRAREREGSTRASGARERTRPVEGREPSSAPETPGIERRERFERGARGLEMPSREVAPRDMSSGRSFRQPRVGRESPSRIRATESGGSPGRGRSERAEPRPLSSPARDVGGGGRSFRERGASGSAPSSGARAGGGASGRSKGSQSPGGSGSARPRSNRS